MINFKQWLLERWEDERDPDWWKGDQDQQDPTPPAIRKRMGAYYEPDQKKDDSFEVQVWSWNTSGGKTEIEWAPSDDRAGGEPWAYVWENGKIRKDIGDAALAKSWDAWSVIAPVIRAFDKKYGKHISGRKMVTA